MDFNSDKCLEDGELGRIVITDLFNYAMPLIRYDTGDVGVKGIKDEKQVLTKVEGRKTDLLTNTQGELIPLNLVLIVNKYMELKQCQIIQKTKDSYVFKINIKKKFSRKDQFLKEFRQYLGDDAKISLEYVDEIPLLNSGKRKTMINETIT